MDMVKVAVESRNLVFRKSGHSKKLVVFFRRMFQHKVQSCTRIVPKRRQQEAHVAQLL